MYRDDTDGTSSETVAANQWAWDATSGGWVKVSVDHATGSLIVGGNVASGAADSGNPVKVGGRYNATQPTLLDGQRGDIQLNPRGAVEIAWSASGVAGDGNAAPSAVLDVTGTARSLANSALLFNETSWDRQRGNTTAVLVAAGTITTQTNKAITNYNGRFLEVVLNITAATSTPTATVAISGTTASGFAFPILTGAAIVSTGTTVYRVGPGLTTLTNLTVNDSVPRNILVTVAITGSVTYGVDYVLSV